MDIKNTEQKSSAMEGEKMTVEEAIELYKEMKKENKFESAGGKVEFLQRLGFKFENANGFLMVFAATKGFDNIARYLRREAEKRGIEFEI